MSEPRGRHVLVIDDDDLSREVLGLLLAEDGFVVEAAESGEAALSGLEGGVLPDVVLMDVQMPGLSGEALAEQLRARCGAGTPVVAMSGSRSALSDSEVFDAFLLKPFSMEVFAETLRGLESGCAEGGVVQLAASAEDGDGDAGAAVLDTEVFESFRAMAGEEALREIYGLCLRDAAEQGARLEEAAVRGDDAGFRRGAHATKGSLGMLGARELQAVCARMEKEGLRDDKMTSLREFSGALGRLRDMLVARGIKVTELVTKVTGA